MADLDARDVDEPPPPREGPGPEVADDTMANFGNGVLSESENVASSYSSSSSDRKEPAVPMGTAGAEVGWEMGKLFAGDVIERPWRVGRVGALGLDVAEADSVGRSRAVGFITVMGFIGFRAVGVMLPVWCEVEGRDSASPL